LDDESQASLLHRQVIQVALECIRAGAKPNVIGKYGQLVTVNDKCLFFWWMSKYKFILCYS